MSTQPSADVRPFYYRLAIAGVSVVVLGMSIYAAFVTFSRPVTATLPSGHTAIVLEAAEGRWLPRSLSMPARTDTQILVRNLDWFAHTFSAPALGIDSVYIAPKSERSFEIHAPSAGIYRFGCDVTGHEDMVGTFRASKRFEDARKPLSTQHQGRP